MSTEKKKIEDPAASASATEENKIEDPASSASNGEVFEIDRDITMQFQTVKSFFQDKGVGDMVMPVLNMHSAELVNIIDFYTKTQHLHRKVKHNEA
ncbi:hypothetical protein C1H46_007871 [Malus baccata]|uniref:SKP1 component POZ domain-containing protein n=1 Tax=Malus baccata TaxID=106549 RepID=A0A540N7N5_MALBA|nr:hypothetical protein C1H46_007871 [Malus baccata]